MELTELREARTLEGKIERVGDLAATQADFISWLSWIVLTQACRCLFGMLISFSLSICSDVSRLFICGN